LPADGQQQQQQLAGWWCWSTTNVTFWPLVIGKSWKEERKQIKNKTSQRAYLSLILDGPFNGWITADQCTRLFGALNTVNTHQTSFFLSKRWERKNHSVLSTHTHTHRVKHWTHTHTHWTHVREKFLFSLYLFEGSKENIEMPGHLIVIHSVANQLAVYHFVFQQYY
jgi:hypothetical protein